MTALHVSLVGRKDLSGEIYRQVRRAIRASAAAGPATVCRPAVSWRGSWPWRAATVTVAYERLAAEGFVAFRQGRRNVRWRPGGAVGARQDSASSRRRAPAAPDLAIDRRFRPRSRSRRGSTFAPGFGDASLFPDREWRRAVTRALRSSATTAGAYEQPAGRRDLRTAIVRHIGVSRGVEASADDIVITNGTQQALDLLARVLLAPGDAIAVEESGLRAPENSCSRRWEFGCSAYRWIARAWSSTRCRCDVRAVYVTPSHQYPLSVTLTLPRRRALLAWAEQNNAAIIEDDYDSEFRFGETSPRAVADPRHERPGRLRGLVLEDDAADAPARLPGDAAVAAGGPAQGKVRQRLAFISLSRRRHSRGSSMTVALARHVRRATAIYRGTARDAQRTLSSSRSFADHPRTRSVNNRAAPHPLWLRECGRTRLPRSPAAQPSAASKSRVLSSFFA